MVCLDLPVFRRNSHTIARFSTLALAARLSDDNGMHIHILDPLRTLVPTIKHLGGLHFEHTF